MKEPFDGNPGKFTDGDLVPCIGGPADGLKRRVEVILPVLNGGLASSDMLWRSGATVHRYKLDHVRRAWVYDCAVRVPATSR
jgi:hypothetical protein